MFPFTITYTKPIVFTTKENKQEIKEILIQLVKSNDARVVSTDNIQLTFRVRWFVTSWGKFFSIDKGVFTLTDDTFYFTFSVYWIIVLAILGSIGMGYGVSVWLGVFSFVVVGLGNYITTLIRCRHLTDDIAAIINKELKTKKNFS